ncbi:MAG: hypothetical protein ACOC44_13595 [Promethearchaeia archaeon]
MKLPKELREKQELKGASGKTKRCSVQGCSKKAIRSLSENKWAPYCEKAGLNIAENRFHKIYLCKKHYKKAKKVRKSDEKLYQKKGFLKDASSRGNGRWLGE